MWGEGFDDRAHLLDDALIQADLMAELQETSFWEGYREDGVPIEERSYEDEIDWSEAA
jgi:hypothetical protein